MAYLYAEDAPDRKLGSLLSFLEDIVDVVEVASYELDLF
jgi:hypothetical protein